MEKFHILVYALQKLYMGVEGSCSTENPDHVMLQEVLLGGHLYLMLLKDKLLNWLQAVQYGVIRKVAQDKSHILKSGRCMVKVLN
jgi:DNA-directed RNA polymerase I subunit RPA2